jgi:hypothetical protein
VAMFLFMFKLMLPLNVAQCTIGGHEFVSM